MADVLDNLKYDLIVAALVWCAHFYLHAARWIGKSLRPVKFFDIPRKKFISFITTQDMNATNGRTTNNGKENTMETNRACNFLCIGILIFSLVGLAGCETRRPSRGELLSPTYKNEREPVGGLLYPGDRTVPHQAAVTGATAWSEITGQGAQVIVKMNGGKTVLAEDGIPLGFSPDGTLLVYFERQDKTKTEAFFLFNMKTGRKELLASRKIEVATENVPVYLPEANGEINWKERLVKFSINGNLWTFKF